MREFQIDDHETYFQSGEAHSNFIAYVRERLSRNDAQALKTRLTSLHESDLAQLMTSLDDDERLSLIAALGEDFDFTALTELDDTLCATLLTALSHETVARGIAELDSDDAARLLENFSDEGKRAILARLPMRNRLTIKRNLDYPEETAGRRMQASYVCVPPSWTVGQVIDSIRARDDLPDVFHEIFVVDAENVIKGTVVLSRLLHAKRLTLVSDVMAQPDHVAHVNDDQEKVAAVFRRYNLASMPVVDDNFCLAGVLTIDDMVDVIEEEADEDIRALAGVKVDETFSDSVFRLARGRFSWLAINLVTAFFASSILNAFSRQLEAIIALAVLAPIIASQSGNAATQTMTVIVRALSNGEVAQHNALKVFFREGAAGFLNGIAFAFIAAVASGFWFQSFDIGYVVASAMLVSLCVAGLAGVAVPFIFNHWGADPAVSSAPFVTMITDVVGFFSLLAIATLWLGL